MHFEKLAFFTAIGYVRRYEEGVYSFKNRSKVFLWTSASLYSFGRSFAMARNFISFNYTDIICAVLVYFKIFHAILALACFGLMSTIMDDLSWSIVLTCSMQITVLARFAIHWDVRKHDVHLYGLVLVVGEY